MAQPQVDISSLFSLQYSSVFDKPSQISLATAGAACLLGRGDATSTMPPVHVYTNKRWLGWYNIPGSFQIAQQLNSLAKSKSFRSDLPQMFFQSDDSKGAKFHGVYSGTLIRETSYSAALLIDKCVGLKGEQPVGRRTQPVGVTVAHLDQVPASEMSLTSHGSSSTLFAIVSIAASVSACALCVVCRDWIASFLIFIGIFANGISCLIFGDFVFTHPNPARGAPPGDGILESDKDMVVLLGQEGAVNSVTRGEFYLRFSGDPRILILWCSILFYIQSITQLFLIPQASSFGQFMFLVSLGVSTLYNAWLSWSGKDKLHREVLLREVLGRPKLIKFAMGTRTTAVVFMLLVLRSSDSTKLNMMGLLDQFLPDNDVWRHWKTKIVEWLRDPNVESLNQAKTESIEFKQDDQILLGQLYQDAKSAYEAMLNISNTRNSDR